MKNVLLGHVPWFTLSFLNLMFRTDLELWKFMLKVGPYTNDFIIDDYVYTVLKKKTTTLLSFLIKHKNIE